MGYDSYKPLQKARGWRSRGGWKELRGSDACSNVGFVGAEEEGQKLLYARPGLGQLGLIFKSHSQKWMALGSVGVP